MRKLILTTTCLVALSGTVLAQAIAEGALTHGAAATASSGAGKALGGVVNQLAGKLGQQTSNAVHPAVTTVKPGVQGPTKIPQTATTTATPPAGGSLIASVQGEAAQPSESPCAAGQGVKASADASSDARRASNCAGAKKYSAAEEKAAHPSEITLPPAK